MDGPTDLVELIQHRIETGLEKGTITSKVPFGTGSGKAN